MDIMNSIKAKLVKNIIFIRVVSYLTRHIPRVFFYHSFTNNAFDDSKVFNETFRWQLEQLSNRWHVLSFGDYLKLIKNEQKVPKYTVVLTIDDGYLDFFTFAYPLLKEFKMRATLFVTVRFISGRYWLWHDILKYILIRSKKSFIELTFNKQIIKINLSDDKNIKEKWNKISNFCITLEDNIKWQFIEYLIKETGVALPINPPYPYNAVNFDQLEEMSKNGVEIGAHTMTHPILSQVKDKDLSYEIRYSKKVLEEKLKINIISFCYPNGMPQDISEKAVLEVKRTNYLGSCVTSPYIKRQIDPYKIPRLGINGDKIDFLWKLSGMEILIYKTKEKIKKLLRFYE